MCDRDGLGSTTVWLVRYFMRWLIRSVGFAIGLALGSVLCAAGMLLLHYGDQAMQATREDEQEREGKGWS